MQPESVVWRKIPGTRLRKIMRRDMFLAMVQQKTENFVP